MSIEEIFRSEEFGQKWMFPDSPINLDVIAANSKSCSARGFKALMATQFLGALNDNVFRLIVGLMIVDKLLAGESSTFYLSVSESLFTLPFVLFSAYSGYLADRFSKSFVIIITKVLEVIVMGFGAYFFYTQNVGALIGVLFFMGLQSTIFSPCKYGILPEILDDKHLSKGNGYLEFWTFLAIIFGTALGGIVKQFSDEKLLLPGIVVLTFSIIGLITSFGISKTTPLGEAKAFRLNPLDDVIKTFRGIKAHKGLYLAMWANIYFWGLAVYFKLNTILYAKQLMGIGDLQTSYLFAALALGIGVGSVVAGKVSEGKVEMGLLPIGAIGMSIFSFSLAFTHQSFLMTLIALALLGISSGFYVVPVNSYVQQKSPAESRGMYLATMNILAFLAMCVASYIPWLLIDGLGLSQATLFIIATIASLVATWIICKTLPEIMARCVNWILAHVFYKVKVVGVENVPQQGGALIVCNHASFADPSLILAALVRPIRFLMFRPIFEAPIVNRIAKIMRAIPISGMEKPKAMIKSLRDASEAITAGDLVGIFAEGAITRTGNMLPFSKGLEKIMEEVDQPIIPVYLDQIWGSIFSFERGRFFFKIPRKVPYPVTLIFGKPLPGNSTASTVRQAVQELSSQAYEYRSAEDRVLPRLFLQVAKRFCYSPCISDSTGANLRYGSVLGGSLLFADKIKNYAGNTKMVGILLPPSVAGVIANLGVLISGKVPVNLNYTASEDSITSAVARCEINTILTSKAFIEKLPQFAKLSGLVFVEDIKKSIVFGEKLLKLFQAYLVPGFILRRMYSGFSVSPDDTATVIFSSGSTGEPKGVVLSHKNISSNVQSLRDIFELGQHEGFMGVLPFFHSFGFMGTIWLPLLTGTPVVYHPNPLDAGAVGELVEKHQATVLLATPTFLLGYIRKCSAEQFKSLRRVIVGAEKLKERVAESFHKKFGLVPLEGYGCTELSPVAVMNVPDIEERDVKQVGQKLGTVGHPLPGVAVRVVNPDTREVLKPGEEGLLLVKGPNVMCGYLNDEKRTAEVIQDGWYVTGDIARLDEDGFLTITDRLSRFSKIGGEMIPHGKIEDDIHEILGVREQVCVVTGVPDEKKGEKLVVLSVKEVDVDMIVERLSEKGYSNLFIPKKENFFQIDSLPLLGTGKLDLRAIKAQAIELTEVAPDKNI